MKIMVLGAGTVGTSIAEVLCDHGHVVTVVDRLPQRIRRINERLDVKAITGSVSESSVLFQAGVMSSDVCLAVTGSDEVNLIAASMARAMGARRAMARVYAPIFSDMSTFDYQRHFHIDRLLSLEYLSAMEFARAIRHPGSIAVENLARGELEVQDLVVSAKSDVLETPLKDLHLPSGVRIGSILHNGGVRIAGADDELANGDRITLIGTRDDIDRVAGRFQMETPPKQNITIAGGGETGYHLAKTLETGRFSVLVMEVNKDRCHYLAERFQKATVVHCDCTRRRNLEEERVGNADVFVACTGDDEDNIMAGVEAREIGAKVIMSVVGRPDYANVVAKLGIDHVVSPREVMAKQVLGLVNTGAVISRSPLGEGEINIMEIEVMAGAPATEHDLSHLPLPDDCLIAAVMREGFVKVPGADDRMRKEDTVIVLVESAAIGDTLRLFETPK